MGDKQHGTGVFAREFDQLFLHDHTGLGIQSTKRLVHQQDLWVERIGARNGHTLLHAP